MQRRRRKPLPTVGEMVDGILKGDVTTLSRAVTLVESLSQEHQALAQEIIEKCLPHSGNSRRIGITGVPGAGKSTSIDAFGLHVLKDGGKLAVLAIDPSSERTKGSILGDKTRMEKLSIHPNAFIRPSPSAGSLEGLLARHAKQSCCAKQQDTIISLSKLWVWDKAKLPYTQWLISSCSSNLQAPAMNYKVSNAVLWKWPMA